MIVKIFALLTILSTIITGQDRPDEIKTSKTIDTAKVAMKNKSIMSSIDPGNDPKRSTITSSSQTSPTLSTSPIDGDIRFKWFDIVFGESAYPDNEQSKPVITDKNGKSLDLQTINDHDESTSKHLYKVHSPDDKLDIKGILSSFGIFDHIPTYPHKMGPLDIIEEKFRSG